MWFQEAEGAKFWLQVLNELKQRGVQDVLICCVDGLKGFPEAIEAERTAPAGAPDADPQVRVGEVAIGGRRQDRGTRRLPAATRGGDVDRRPRSRS